MEGVMQLSLFSYIIFRNRADLRCWCSVFREILFTIISQRISHNKFASLSMKIDMDAQYSSRTLTRGQGTRIRTRTIDSVSTRNISARSITALGYKQKLMTYRYGSQETAWYLKCSLSDKNSREQDCMSDRKLLPWMRYSSSRRHCTSRTLTINAYSLIDISNDVPITHDLGRAPRC